MAAGDYAAPILRRWYIVLTGLLLTLGLTVAVGQSTEPSYQAEAEAVLLPGPSAIPEGGNPFLYLGGLLQARDVIVLSLNSDAARKEILGGMDDWDYVAAPDTTANGPLIVITATAANPAQALQLRDDVLGALGTRITTVQDEAGTPESSRFTSLIVSQSADAQASGSGTQRATISVGALGLGLSLLAAGAFDTLVRERRLTQLRRRNQMSQPADPDAGESDGAPGVQSLGVGTFGRDGGTAPGRSGPEAMQRVRP